MSKGCPPSLAVLHQRLHQARLPGWRKMESLWRTPPRVQGLVAVGECGQAVEWERGGQGKALSLLMVPLPQVQPSEDENAHRAWSSRPG